MQKSEDGSISKEHGEFEQWPRGVKWYDTYWKTTCISEYLAKVINP